MRRRTLLLAAGSLAYFIGASLGGHLRPDAGPCGGRETGRRTPAAAPRPALGHTPAVTEHLATSQRPG